MKRFKGTEGEWFVYGDKYPRIESKNTDERIIVTFPTIAVVTSTFINKEEYTANAKLIASAKKLLKIVLKEKEDLEEDINNNTTYQNEKLELINKVLDEAL